MPELNKTAECRKPATTGDVSKVVFSILDRAKELNIIISEVNNELVGSPMEVHEEKEGKKASEGWIDDKYRTLCEIREQINRALDKIQLLKSRLKTEK